MTMQFSIFVFCMGSSFLFLIIRAGNYFKNNMSASVFFLLGILLIVFAVFRPSSLPDYSQYYKFFNHQDKVLEYRIELGSRIFRFFSNSFKVFLLWHAAFAILIKFFSIKQFSKLPILSVISYIATSYSLHDLIQIRISCAIGIFLVAVNFLAKKKIFNYFVMILLAALFHKSAIVFFIFCFLGIKRYNHFFYSLLILIAYGMASVNFGIIKLFEILLPAKSYYFMSILENNTFTTIDIFNFEQLLSLMVFFLVSPNIRRINNRLLSIYMKVFAISIIVIPFFSSVSLVAARFSEMLRPAIIFVLPYVVYSLKNKSIGYAIFLVFCFCYSVLNNFWYL